MRINIITDSTSDLSKEYAEKNQVTVLPIGIEFDGDFFLEGVDITNKEFYDKLKVASKLPHTSQINEYSYTEAIEKNDGKDVLHCILPISKELSNSHYSAISAAKSLGKDNVYICDTMTTTVGLAMLVNQAVELSKEKDITKEKFIEKLEAFKSRIGIYAIIGDLKYLKMGGRLSASSSFIGTMLKITPLVELDGKVSILAKHIGKNKSFAHLAKMCAGRDTNYPLYIANADCKETLNALLEREKEVLQLDGTEKHFEMGAAIGTHTGIGTIAIAFVK